MSDADSCPPAELELWLVRLALYSLSASIETDCAAAAGGGCHDCRSAQGRFGPAAACRTHRQDRALLVAVHAAYRAVAGDCGPDPWQDPRWQAALAAAHPQVVNGPFQSRRRTAPATAVGAAHPSTGRGWAR
jgi:hypothetical protein